MQKANCHSHFSTCRTWKRAVTHSASPRCSTGGRQLSLSSCPCTGRAAKSRRGRWTCTSGPTRHRCRSGAGPRSCPPAGARPQRPRRLGRSGLPSSPSAGMGGARSSLTDFVRLDRMAASSGAEAPGGRLVHLEEGRVIATVRLTVDRQLAVALETQDPQCAARQWGFCVTRDDGTEISRATIALQLCPEQPGLWEGRVEVPLLFPEGCSFAFYSLPHDLGAMP